MDLVARSKRRVLAVLLLRNTRFVRAARPRMTRGDNPLWGRRRGLVTPPMALSTLHRLGPVRHALAQRAVCGVLEVHAPFPGFAPKAEKTK